MKVIDMLETGRICMKIAGREAGSYCVVLQPGEKFAMISGPKSITRVRRRKCSIFHLEPTSEKLNISDNADDSALENAWKESGLIEKMKIEIPKKRTKQPKQEKK